MWLLFASLSSIHFAIRGILFQILSRKPADRTLILIGMFFTGTIISLVGTLVTESLWNIISLFGILMGVFSYLGNMSMFKAYATGKPTYVALLVVMAPVIVTISAFMLWRETLTGLQLFTLVLIMSGLILVRISGDFNLHDRRGTGWALVALFAFSIIDLTNKQAMLLEGSVFTLTFFMFLSGTICFLIEYSVTNRKNAKPFHFFGKHESGHWSVTKCLSIGALSGVAGAGGMIFALPAMKLGNTGLVSAVIGSQIVIIVLYSAIFRRIPVTRIEYLGIAVVTLGIFFLVY